ncbi:hypothetical protein A6A19_08330 [Actinobacillus delphinicola]|uniref:Peptidase M23B n=1 Tax=Actinobacillus delphinicola TaxID=51161 RepID=A0A448TV93_9PAST|nr:murein DD-endopeptidase MepM [Actinobacillus delphinicola]MDG6897980.1 hypothetical protein [Actinobacillus delphinicola]VEJ09847.1 peptidase M23B [Actinobacillus delphinicola]
MGSPSKKTQRIVWSSIAVIVSLVAGTALHNTYGTHTTASSMPPHTLSAKNSMLTPISENDQKDATAAKSDQNTADDNTPDSDDLSVDDINGKDDEVEQVEDVSDVADEASLPENAKTAIDNLLDATEQARQITEQFTHTVQKGDTLSKILSDSGLEDHIGHQLVKQFPEFETQLRPGQKIYWTLNNDGKLMYLNWLPSNREERIYIRTPQNTFTSKIIKQQSEWKTQILHGNIDHSFVKSFQDLGLNSIAANQASSALQWQTNMRHLQKGDKFTIEVSREFINNKPTGRADVKAIHLRTGKTDFYAIQAANGRFYDEYGNSTGKGFNRYPFNFVPRISSPFNLHRRHPITGVIRPHKGVDFAVPMGTRVLATADGVIQKVAFQAHGAGRYIVIRHSRKYQTVYMHLHRILVRAGQKVKRGQEIALSGNSGLSTGPHLHYEFRINGQPWNPMSVKLPNVVNLMTDKQRAQFLALAKKVKKELTISTNTTK